MPQDNDTQVPELRKQMRAGRTPLIEACRTTWQQFYIANKGLTRKYDELREQVGLLQNEFLAKGKQLKDSRKTSSLREERGDSTATIPLFEVLSQQAKAVSEPIDKELPKLHKLDEPVAKQYAAYQEALGKYNAYTATWRGRLPDQDLSGRALELALESVEKALR